MIDVQQFPMLHPQVADRQVDGQTIVVLVNSGEVMVLNDIGTKIWAWIDGLQTVQQLAERLQSAYKIPAEAALNDTTEFMQKLLDASAIVLRCAPQEQI